MSSVSITTSTPNFAELPRTAAQCAPARLSVLERFLLGAIIIEIPLQIDVSLFYSDRWGDLGAIGGLNISLTTLCLGVLYGLWLVQKATQLTVREPRPLRLPLPALAYLAFTSSSVLIAQNRALAFFGVCLLVQALLIYIYVANRLTDLSDVENVARWLMVSLSVQSAIMIAMRFIGHEVRIGSVAAYIEPDGRVGGTLVTPNQAASYLELLMAPALALFVTPIGGRTKVFTGLALLLGGAAIFLTLSRGGWLVTGCSVALFCLMAWRRGWIPGRPLAAGAVLIALIGGLEFNTIENRMLSNDQGAVTTRFPLLSMSRDMIADRPLIGVGANNYAFAASKYALASEFREDWFHTVHNKYLLEWAELGLFGLAAFVWFLISTLRMGWQAALRTNDPSAPIALAMTLAIFGQMFHMMVDIFAGRPQVQMLWLCAGLVAAIYYWPHQDAQTAIEPAVVT